LKFFIIHSFIAKEFVDELISKYKKLVCDKTNKIENPKIKIIKTEKYFENKITIQGNNVNNMKNLKNFKNVNEIIIIKGIKDLKQDKMITNNEPIEDTKKQLFLDKSNSITNSNNRTNPSTVYKSDSIKHNFQQCLAQDKSNKNVKYFYILFS
jgi:hypothetical protein